MKYFKNGTWCNDDTVTELPEGATALTDAAWEIRLGAGIVPSAAEIKATNIKKVDADIDAIYAAVIGNRTTEYSEAEAQASAFKAAGYTGTVPDYVANWLSNNTKGFATATQAADDILAQAAAWRGAAKAMRNNRLLAKKNLANDVTTAMAQWNGFVAAMRGSLGL